MRNIKKNQSLNKYISTPRLQTSSNVMALLEAEDKVVLTDGMAAAHRVS